MKKHLLIILFMSQTILAMRNQGPMADDSMIDAMQYRPEQTYQDFIYKFNTAKDALTSDLVKLENPMATLILFNFIQKFYDPISKYDYKVIQYYACKQKINSIDDISQEMVCDVVGAQTFEASDEETVKKYADHIFKTILEIQVRRKTFFKCLIESTPLNELYQSLLSEVEIKTDYRILSQMFVAFEGTTIEHLKSSDPEKCQKQAALIQENIFLASPFLHLIVKHFGEIFGFFNFNT